MGDLILAKAVAAKEDTSKTSIKQPPEYLSKHGGAKTGRDANHHPLYGITHAAYSDAEVNGLDGRIGERRCIPL